MTLSKLAKLANVSVSVVSKAFSGRDDVSEEMRERVFAVDSILGQACGVDKDPRAEEHCCHTENAGRHVGCGGGKTRAELYSRCHEAVAEHTEHGYRDTGIR